MNKSYKAASSVGAVALVLSGSAMAVAPTFDQWSVTNGGITSSVCSSLGADFSCGAALSDVGFFQRMVVDTVNSLTYFQTIITENNADSTAGLDTLKFSDESFVRTGNVNGIADKQRISETLSGTTFKASTTLAAGWAGYSLGLTQSLKDSADNFQTDFLFSQKGDSSVTGGVTGKGMKITAYVPLEGLTGTDKQDFVLIDLQGDYTKLASGTPVSGSVTIPGTPAQTMTWLNDTVAGNTGTVGEHIKAVYVGQDLTNIVGQVFGFNSYENVTTPNFISAFSLTSAAPVAWDTAVWGDTVTAGTITDPFNPW